MNTETGEKDNLITVCVTVYNIADYLGRCLDSILAQTYKDLDILLIDDGSCDGSEKICDEYAARDARVRVIHKTNGGVSSARNMGLDKALGTFFTYVDGDDYIDPDMYERLMHEIREHDADMAVCRYRHVVKGEVTEDHSSDKVCVFEGLDLLEHYLYEDDRYAIQNAPWNKVYRRSLAEDLRFPEGIYEDALFSPMLLSRVSKAVYVDRAYYNYSRDRETSIMHKDVINPHIFTDLLPNFEKRSEYIDRLGRSDLLAISDYFFFKRLLIFVTQVNRSADKDKKKHLDILDEYIRRYSDRFDAAFNCKVANPNEYRKMKIYLRSRLLYRITMFINDRVIIPIKTR